TQKALLAKAVMTNCGVNFFSVKGLELLNIYIGELEAKTRRVFERSRGARPCVIFFDKLDIVAPQRGNQGDSGGVMNRSVTKIHPHQPILATIKEKLSSLKQQNSPDLFDPALLRPGRFDKMIYLGIAETREEKYQIWKSLTRNFKLRVIISLNQLLCNLFRSHDEMHRSKD
ncbi:ATPase family associated with various cellular activities-domain-containing protein, partial [Phakopsora pachyrhizi]